MNHVDSPFINPRILSYCPGILGLERGLKRALGPIRTAAYVEIEAFICENLLAGMEAGLVDAAPIWCNLKTFYAPPFRGIVDGIIGGYPCQPFSHAGERKGTEDPRHLWPYLEKHIGTIRPVWCFFENVSGHLSLGFAEVRESLSNMGYAVEAGIFTAEEVGAPHERERLFILAIRRDWLADAPGLRRSKGEPEPEGWQRRYASFVGCSMANAQSGDRGLQLFQRRPQQSIPEPAGASEALGYAEGDGQAFGFAIGTSAEVAGTRSSDTNRLANCDDPGCEEQRLCFATGPEQSTAEYLRADRWPARPGEPQHEWEAPRVESSVGYAIDGYNYREDLLRAAGNSVVEQTAELAFKELIRKHLK